MNTKNNIEDKLKPSDCKSLLIRDKDGDGMLVCMNESFVCPYVFIRTNSYNPKIKTYYCTSVVEGNKNK